MSYVARWSRIAVLFVAALFSTAGLAAEAPEGAQGPEWTCWYAPRDLTVRCLLIRLPGTEEIAREAQVARRIDPRLPALVRVIWVTPEELVGRQVSIPMWSVPDDMGFVRQLAESVMCGTRDTCAVAFDANPDGRAPLRAAAAAARVSEEDVLQALSDEGVIPDFSAPQNDVVSAAEASDSPRRRRRAA